MVYGIKPRAASTAAVIRLLMDCGLALSVVTLPSDDYRTLAAASGLAGARVTAYGCGHQPGGKSVEIVIINFSLEGITEPEYEKMCTEIAPALAAVPGLVSKVWLAERANGVYGGVYTFEDGDAVDAFMGSELFAEVGATPGLAGISVRRFEVLSAPTGITRGLVGSVA